MKKLLPLFVLLCTTVAFTQNGQPANTSTPAAGSKNNAIADPAEFAAYSDASNVADPAARAAALEAFLARYPNTVAKLPALLQELTAYQQQGNEDKLQEAARSILAIDPNNVTALVVDVGLPYMKGEKGDAAAATVAGSEAKKALQALASWQKPEDMSQADYEAKRKQMANLFNSAAAFGALQDKDYGAACDYYSRLIEADPSVLVNYRRLGFANLQMTPADVAGFWYLAKAVTLAQAQHDDTSTQQIGADAKDRYRRYHGSSEGWDQIVLAAAGQPTLPAGFTVKAKPTECEQVVAQVQNADMTAFGVSDWEMILSHRDCSPQAKPVAGKMWQAIQDKQKSNNVGKLAFPAVKVISATADTVQAAITDDNQQANKADLQFTVEKPFATPPVVGAQLDVVGVVADYKPNPFMFIMQNAEAQAVKPAAPKKSAHPVKRAAKPRTKVKSALR